MATKSVDVGDMFLMDLTDSLDDTDEQQQHIQQPNLLFIDTQFNDLQSISQIHHQQQQQRKSHEHISRNNSILSTNNNNSGDTFAPISMPNMPVAPNNFHHHQLYHRQQQQPHHVYSNHLQQRQAESAHLLSTPLAPSAARATHGLGSSLNIEAGVTTQQFLAASTRAAMSQDVILEDSGFSDKLEEANIFVEVSTPNSSSSGTSINLSDNASSKSSTNLSDDIVSIASSDSSNQIASSTADCGAVNKARRNNDKAAHADGHDDDDDDDDVARAFANANKALLLNNITGTNLINTNNQRPNIDHRSVSGHLNNHHRRRRLQQHYINNQQYLSNNNNNNKSQQAAAAVAASSSQLSASLPIEVPIVARQNIKFNSKNLRFTSKLSDDIKSSGAVDSGNVGRSSQFSSAAAASYSSKAAYVTTADNACEAVVSNVNGSNVGNNNRAQTPRNYLNDNDDNPLSGRRLYQVAECDDVYNENHQNYCPIDNLDDEHLQDGCGATAAVDDDFEDEDSLSEDDYAAIRENPGKILKSIEALARSVHDDNEVFGSLPRRQFNTGELVRSLRLA